MKKSTSQEIVIPLYWDDNQSLMALECACIQYRHNDVDHIIKQYLDFLKETQEFVPAKTAREILLLLRKHTHFDWIYLVADAIAANGQHDFTVRRELAQALIEQGKITNAIARLIQCKSDLESTLKKNKSMSPRQIEQIRFDLGETYGLLGRAYKQLYFNANPCPGEPRSSDLEKALWYYKYAFTHKLGDYFWHGTNYIALLTNKIRVKENRIVYSAEAQRISRTLLTAIKKKGREDSWDDANCMECLLAQGKNREAMDYLKRYLSVKGLNAYNLQSTRRQLEQTWLLNENEKFGRNILSMFTARQAELGGSDVQIKLQPGKQFNFEAIFGETKYQPLRWLADGVSRSPAIVRLGKDAYSGHGTGFVIGGGSISKKWSARNLLITNTHVCTSNTEHQKMWPKPYLPEFLRAYFLNAGENAGNVSQAEISNELWSSPHDWLDAAVFEIKDVPGSIRPLQVNENIQLTIGDRINIIGYPKGGEASVSLHDNRILNMDRDYIYYQAPTEHGSSGSPVFDQGWNLVAIHSSFDPRRNANRGIKIDVILKNMKKELKL